MSTDSVRQIYMLRRQCFFQRAIGTPRDNGYPYHKHVQDCDVCSSADLLERLQKRIHHMEDIMAVYVDPTGMDEDDAHLCSEAFASWEQRQ